VRRMNENNPSPIVLTVHRRGVPEFQRYVISDQYLRYWTGTEWSSNENQAELFCDNNEALERVQKLLLLDLGPMPARRFQAPVFLDIYSDQEISVRDLKAWLTKVAKLLMDSPRHGNGPIQGTLGLTWIDWSKLKELTAEEM
jgi:hypothetical protein